MEKDNSWGGAAVKGTTRKSILCDDVEIKNKTQYAKLPSMKVICQN